MSDKISLKIFVDKNQSLLVAAGIFAAITAFFSSDDSLISLSFITFIIFLLLCWELWINFPKSEEASANLKIFEILFITLVFGVGSVIIIKYIDFIYMFLPVFIFISYVLIVFKLLDKCKYYIFIDNIAKKYDKFNHIIRSLGFIIPLGLCGLCAIYSMKLIKYIINGQ